MEEEEFHRNYATLGELYGSQTTHLEKVPHLSGGFWNDLIENIPFRVHFHSQETAWTRPPPVFLSGDVAFCISIT